MKSPSWVQVGFVVIIIMALAACQSQASERHMLPVSMISILVSPEKYEGRRLQIKGYFSLTPAGLLLFLTKDHSDIYDVSSSVAVMDDTDDGELFDSDCLRRYVTIEGTLRAEGASWELTEIERVIDLERGARNCWVRLH